MKNGIAAKMEPQVPSDPSSKNCKDLDQKEAVRFNEAASFCPNFLYGLSIFRILICFHTFHQA